MKRAEAEMNCDGYTGHQRNPAFFIYQLPHASTCVVIAGRLAAVDKEDSALATVSPVWVTVYGNEG